MDYGRRLAARRTWRESDPRTQIRIRQAAVAPFWEILPEVCALGGPPERWLKSAH